MNNYLQILMKVLEKIPFLEFRKRMWGFIKNPTIDNSYASITQLQHSGIDIFNALGFLSIVCVFLALFEQSWTVFKVVSVFNPLYMIGVHIGNGVVYSFTLSSIFTIWYCLKVGNVNHYKDISYKIFAHGLRIYALYGLLLGLLFIKSYGDFLLNGICPKQSFSHLGWATYIVVALVWWPFRLLVNPIYKLMAFNNHKKIAWLLAVLICFTSFQPLKIILIGSSDRLVNYEQQCKIFKSGTFYKGMERSRKEKAENYFCNATHKGE